MRLVDILIDIVYGCVIRQPPYLAHGDCRCIEPLLEERSSKEGVMGLVEHGCKRAICVNQGVVSGPETVTVESMHVRSVDGTRTVVRPHLAPSRSFL